MIINFKEENMMASEYSSELKIAKSSTDWLLSREVFLVFRLRPPHQPGWKPKSYIILRTTFTGQGDEDWLYSNSGLAQQFSGVTTLALEDATTEICQEAICFVLFSSNTDWFEHIHPINLVSLDLTLSFVISNFERVFCAKLSHMISIPVTWASFIPSLSNWIN